MPLPDCSALLFYANLSILGEFVLIGKYIVIICTSFGPISLKPLLDPAAPAACIVPTTRVELWPDINRPGMESSMDTIEAIKVRHSVRAYKAESPSLETIREILSLASRSPSWANTQPWEVYVASGEVLDGIRKSYAANFRNRVQRQPDLAVPGEWPQAHENRMIELRDARTRSLQGEKTAEDIRESMFALNAQLFGAPAVAFICMERSLTPWSIYDLGLFSQTLMLAAAARGVASIPAFNLVAYPDILRDKLAIPDDLSIIMGIALGFEDREDPHNRYRSSRRPVEDFSVFKGF